MGSADTAAKTEPIKTGKNFLRIELFMSSASLAKEAGPPSVERA
jgi:hypothetical protein